MADNPIPDGLGSKLSNIWTSLTAPAAPEDQAKALKMAALLQSQQNNSALDTGDYKGIHAMPTAAAGFGNALLKGVSGYMAGGGTFGAQPSIPMPDLSSLQMPTAPRPVFNPSTNTLVPGR